MLRMNEEAYTFLLQATRYIQRKYTEGRERVHCYQRVCSHVQIDIFDLAPLVLKMFHKYFALALEFVPVAQLTGGYTANMQEAYSFY